MRKWRRLTWRQRGWLLRAALALALVRVALWVLPFRRVWNRITGGRAADVSPPVADADVEMARWAVHAVGRRMPGGTCLVRALTLRYLLGRLGVPCQLRIGVARRGANPLAAHAWVEVDGVPLSDGEELNGYAVLPPLEAKLSAATAPCMNGGIL